MKARDGLSDENEKKNEVPCQSKYDNIQILTAREGNIGNCSARSPIRPKYDKTSYKPEEKISFALCTV